MMPSIEYVFQLTRSRKYTFCFLSIFHIDFVREKERTEAVAATRWMIQSHRYSFSFLFFPVKTDLILVLFRIYQNMQILINLRQALPTPSMEILPESELPEATDELTRDEPTTMNIVENNTNIFDVQQASPSPQDKVAFMKIRLNETEDILLYENNSYTVLTGTDEALTVLADNERYDFLTGQQRRICDVETQTAEQLRKTRAINTDRIDEKAVGAYVSNYDMFDTYAQLERTVQCIDIGRTDNGDDDVEHEKLNVTTYTRNGDVDDLNRQLTTNNTFQLSSMILERILASNVFRESQRRFRNMDMPNPLDPVVQYLYRMKLLWTYRSCEINGSAVTCMSWCPSNADILAIGYGVFNYVLPERRRNGYVCLWTMKVRFKCCSLYCFH